LNRGGPDFGVLERADFGFSVVLGENDSSKLTFEESTLVTATNSSASGEIFCGGKAAEKGSVDSNSLSKLLLCLFDAPEEGSSSSVLQGRSFTVLVLDRLDVYIEVSGFVDDGSRHPCQDDGR
jgi:hypothetical protein